MNLSKNKLPTINEHKYKIPHRSAHRSKASPCCPIEGSRIHPTYPISFGDEDIDQMKYIFMKYEQLLKVPITKFIAIIMRNGFIDKDSFFTIDAVYEYRASNYTFSGYMLNPKIYHVYTLWDSDCMPTQCNIIYNIQKYVEDIKSCEIKKMIWRVPYSSLVNSRYDNRKYEYHNGHVYIGELGFADFYGLDLLEKQYHKIKEHKQKIMDKPIDFKVIMMKQMIAVIKTIKVNDNYKQLTNVLNNLKNQGQDEVKMYIVNILEHLLMIHNINNMMVVAKNILENTKLHNWNMINNTLNICKNINPKCTYTIAENEKQITIKYL